MSKYASREMPSIRRRTVLGGGIGAAAAVALSTRAARAADTNPTTAWNRRAILGEGTTLEVAAAPASSSGYTRLTAGPGYPLTVRTDLCPAPAKRDDTRTARASIVQFTDIHVIDAQSPVRFEWLHEITGSAFRPHEALGTQGGAQLVRRVNELGRGPFSGRAFDCVVTTGDSSDNHEHIELDWFLTLMSGGSITANTGSPIEWEGVQNAGDSFYYLPESSAQDLYKKAGFPTIANFFKHATASHTSEGLQTKWFSVFGNHDDSIEGTLPSDTPILADMYTGGFKFTGFDNTSANLALRSTSVGGQSVIPKSSSLATSRWEVTPDKRRAAFTPREFMAAHLDPKVDGPGPHGHGFTADAIAQGVGYYSFQIAPGVVGISMDSTNRAGFTDGSIGDAQFRWIKRTIEASSSRYYDGWGIEHRTEHTDQLFVLFSHHTSDSMNNLLLAPDKLEIRHSGSELVSTLQRYPNVVAWVNGHTHDNKITPHHHNDPTRSFWEINTASHVDFPQHARIIDVCDNSDGTLSLFTTLIESAAPYEASYSDGSPAALASLYRELSYNDIHRDPKRIGSAADRNTELLLKNPMA